MDLGQVRLHSIMRNFFISKIVFNKDTSMRMHIIIYLNESRTNSAVNKLIVEFKTLSRYLVALVKYRLIMSKSNELPIQHKMLQPYNASLLVMFWS